MTPEAVRNLKERCLGYESRADVMRQNPGLYHRVKRGRLEHICFAHMPLHRRRWDIEELVREARKYATRTQMLAENPALYMAITRRGLHHLLPPSCRVKNK